AFVADPETAPVRSVVLERAHRPVRVKLRDQPLVAASDGVDRGLLAAPQPAAQFFDVAPFEELLEVRVVELGVVGGPWGCVVVPDEVGDAGSLLDPLLAALGLLRAANGACFQEGATVGAVIVVPRQVVSSTDGAGSRV